MNTAASKSNHNGASLDFREAVRTAFHLFSDVVSQQTAELRPRELGFVTEVQRGIAEVVGLPNVQSDEVLRFAGNRHGYAFNLDRDEVGCVLLDGSGQLQAGTRVERTGTVLDAPVGEELLGA